MHELLGGKPKLTLTICNFSDKISLKQRIYISILFMAGGGRGGAGLEVSNYQVEIWILYF